MYPSPISFGQFVCQASKVSSNIQLLIYFDNGSITLGAFSCKASTFRLWTVINIICIVVLAEKYVGTKAIATGWGTLKEDGKPSCILQEVEVPILDNTICVENTNYTQKMITDNMMCAGYPGVGQKDSCQVSEFNYMKAFSAIKSMMFLSEME